MIHWSNLRRIQEFFAGGGAVIATTRLPEQSAEKGHDEDVRKAVATMFGAPGEVRRSARGGRACFFDRSSAGLLREFLDAALPDGDVVFEDSPTVANGNLCYIHKRLGKREAYFFANSSDTKVECRVRLRGKWKLEEWDPHTGMVRAATVKAGAGATGLRLELGPVQSRMFLTV